MVRGHLTVTVVSTIVRWVNVRYTYLRSPWSSSSATATRAVVDVRPRSLIITLISRDGRPERRDPKTDHNGYRYTKPGATPPHDSATHQSLRGDRTPPGARRDTRAPSCLSSYTAASAPRCCICLLNTAALRVRTCACFATSTPAQKTRQHVIHGRSKPASLR